MDDAARLEAALNRIARARAATPAAEAVAQNHASAPTGPAAEAARRLDGLIAEIRSVLGRDAAD